LGIIVAAVDYRLAPEHPYPIPLHDCHDALVHVANKPEVDRDRIIIGGGSAGGGLAAALAALARDRGDVTPILQLLSYPMLDDRTVGRPTGKGNFRLWDNRSNAIGWTAYLGATPGADGIDPLAAPARLDDLAGLPPAWIGVGTLDLFLAEDQNYADRLRAAGVECEVELVTGAFHGFDSVLPHAPLSQSFRAAQARSVATALQG
jgi:acetyl esterase/lipase